MFDSKTERFYYVSGKDAVASSDYATLIYYNNVRGGIPDNTKKYAYNSIVDPSTTIYEGPIIAIKQLPTTSQWKNIKLSNTTRNITNSSGIVQVSDFSYSGYAARLLTFSEANTACGKVGTWKIGELDSCKYLMENTKYSSNSNTSYGSWLETPYLADRGWILGADDRYVYTVTNGISSYIGVRPAIEVEKSKINY